MIVAERSSPTARLIGQKGRRSRRGQMLEDVSADDALAQRGREMRLLARALASELEGPLAQGCADHGARDLKPAETGLMMLRGEAGGDGPRLIALGGSKALPVQCITRSSTREANAFASFS
jgi:alpha-D-ribose 1-methylphosphonate 5-triphosphate synthase subunit PhnG